ncbi:glutathione S-transferase domain-containing protein [Roseibium sp. TrichSKD4]|uniref:glutathione S-transferase family protein n=1 Tax=Roseibium sp. TrichSKD4 TaxID=744980 RepID=UPI0001E572A3|nr:glutathione S-transferase C-terminal domain-containing protein [Roseibium sp. TrichSKD4]EFO28510.1 glutathione S-transferase domain-containing protein [Roseibium sp. TrichSKD4]
MGQLIDGQWVTDEQAGSISKSGEWTRTPSVLRGGLEPEDVTPGRYHLYAAWNCPWAHRVLLTRALLGLQEVLPVSLVAPKRTEDGWVFDPENGYIDQLTERRALHEVYAAGQADYTGRVTVPLLVDTKTGALISNESADLVRMLPPAFAHLAERPRDLYPAELAKDIDAWNALIHTKLNNGVYQAGFAESQPAYDAAVSSVFETLDTIEAALENKPYLTGDDLTEADIRLFPTLARFDVAYYSAFKCMRRRIQDYPNLWPFARRFYALPGIAETVKFDIYRKGYFSQSPKRNPLGIIPIAPDIDWSI